ncbi:putative ferric-chelate reductase 1 [Mya arenaria]|uniref:putative ferric-chelate reductase 1 n=1 Tax=Mya arenaria TaxID=6604 RepID=UPI0022E8103D|nr:putative ferric-chelate reductase 1 [Mya arenaria]XP_052775406.1 putative ferric-chelate reductase 1 [Mya arenaria]XP_052775407.1 putative ferric-chelate reductase 1 [Mya arenaria]XP_052775408.1 putative ferric-chelate reductase 1 [Mya arenaria]XP_052775409.1 putative ferric-chelate reductase 1 [Mya arenaria]XP_052775411.1 putative ferric-chelate reductase 1 [Mya arenaria]
MWDRISVLVSAVLVTWCSVEGFNPDNIQCCNCISMFPDGVSNVKPQVMPSPFIIHVAKSARFYTINAEDINVNLTADFVKRGFRSFMIQARRIDQSSNTIEPIGRFEALEPNPVLAVEDCPGKYGAAFVSSDFSEKTNVRLVWKPPTTFQGHIEFRATFVQDENTFWVKEKSAPLYDPQDITPPTPLQKYIPAPIAGIDVSDCGTRKGCYRIPGDCREVECEYIATWKRLSDRTMQFELSAMTDGFNDRFFALALSEDIYCGDDLVFECVHNSSSGKVSVYQSKNLPENRNDRLNNPTAGIITQEGSYNDGRLRCRFVREINPNNEELNDWGLLSRPFHLLMGRGYSSLGNLLTHGINVGHLPVSSPNEVSLDVGADISGRARFHLVKAHACLMFIAWIFFAPIGLIWMKYYTTMWPNSRFLGQKYWLVTHFNCTVWVVILVVIAVILIFIEAGGWSEFPELPAKAHPILGIIVFICILVIPILFLIRCPEDHACRPVGNWFYWLFWTIAFCLAVVNIFIGMEFGKAMVPWWLTWIVCIFFLFNFVCEIILEVHQCCTHKKNKERRKKWELQKKENPNIHIPEPWPAGRNFKRNVLYTHFIVCLIVVLIAVITVAVS